MVKLCYEFQAGKCGFGARCKFSHDLPHGSQGQSSKQQGGRSHPYLKPNKSTKFERHSDAGQGQQHGNRMQQQQQHSSRAGQPPRPDADAAGGRKQQQMLQQKGSGAQTPLSPSDNEILGGRDYPDYPLPPGEDAAQQQQQQHQQQQQQQQRQKQVVTPLDRARAMCNLLGIGNAAPLVTPQMQASAIQFFKTGAFFRETPFADSIEQYLPPCKQ